MADVCSQLSMALVLFFPLAFFRSIQSHYLIKGGLKAKFFSSYVEKWIRLGQKWSPKKFQSDDVIMGSTEVKLVKF